MIKYITKIFKSGWTNLKRQGFLTLATSIVIFIAVLFNSCRGSIIFCLNIDLGLRIRLIIIAVEKELLFSDKGVGLHYKAAVCFDHLPYPLQVLIKCDVLVPVKTYYKLILPYSREFFFFHRNEKPDHHKD